MAQAFIPHSDREDQAYVMTKWLKFLDTKEDMPWPAHFYESAANATGIKFIMGANGEGNGKDPDIPPGLKNHGLMNQKAFVNAVAHSKLLVGVGMPVTYVLYAYPSLFDSVMYSTGPQRHTRLFVWVFLS